MKAAGDPRRSPGGSVPQGSLVEPRARKLNRPCWLVEQHALRPRPAVTAGRLLRPETGGSVLPGRLVEPRVWSPSPTKPVGRPPWPRARRLSPACMADPAPLPRAQRLSPAGQGGGAPRQRLSPAMKAAGDPRTSPGGSVPQGRLVEPRARRLNPAVQAGGAPCLESQSQQAGRATAVAPSPVAESRRASWWSPAPGG